MHTNLKPLKVSAPIMESFILSTGTIFTWRMAPSGIITQRTEPLSDTNFASDHLKKNKKKRAVLAIMRVCELMRASLRSGEVRERDVV